MLKVEKEKYKILNKQLQFQDQYEENNNAENDKDVESSDKSDEPIRCGVACFHPRWIQVFASKKMYSLAMGIFGLILYGEIASSHANVSSVEKNFSFSVTTVGLLNTVSLASGVVGNFISYAGDRGNKIRWMSFASFIFFVGCVFSVITIFSPISLQNIEAHSSPQYYDNISTVVKLNKENTCSIEPANYSFFRNLIILPFILAQCMVGFANAIHRTCGAAYMDDNIRKNVFPVWYAGIYATQWFGYALGMVVSSYFLKLYVFPTYKPHITNTDPRWIGAWWLGLVLFGVIGLILCPLFLLFPQSLPRTLTRKKTKQQSQTMSWYDFFKTMKNILGNKILMLENLGTTVFALGLSATFWPKYIEIQYGMSSSKSNLMQGLIEFVARPLGTFLASLLIIKLKPRIRVLLGWNLGLTCASFVAFLALIFVGCRSQTINGHMDNSNNWILIEECNVSHNCSKNMQYAPVCDRLQNQVFFSSCHAGCQSSFFNDNKTIFNHCDCVQNAEYVSEGVCHSNCTAMLTAYILLIGFIKTLKASSRAIKVIVEFRSMKENEKALSIGITRSIQVIFSVLPAGMIYSSLLDASCLVWDNKCGMKGNCWLYDTNKLKYKFFVTSSIFVGISVILDILLCIYAKSLKIYDEDFVENPRSDERSGMRDDRARSELQKILLVNEPEKFG